MQTIVNARFVSVDGVDGVGKTTACRSLARVIGAIYHKSPSGLFAAVRARIDGETDPFTRCLFYRAAVQHDAAVIENHLRHGRSVVCDRFIYSTFAYHVALQPSIANTFPWGGIIRPHVSFLLTASAEARARRLASRRTAPGSTPFREGDRLFQDRVDEVFRRLPLFLIDTTTMSAGEVVEQMVRHLGSEAP